MTHTRKPAPPTDPIEAARAAGLRYVHDDTPGGTRLIAGDRTYYLDANRRHIYDTAEIERLNSLAIPPAYTDVWICPQTNGHIQATGRDARGRKQYRYHPRWRAIRDETKYHRLLAFGEALPLIRARVTHDLSLRGQPRDKILAVIIRLLEETHIRIGGEEYARANHTYGLTTLQNRHAQIANSTLFLHFRGKSGKIHTIHIRDPRLARIVKQCQDLPGQELFKYLVVGGPSRHITSDEINAYLHEITGQEFTAKDFRTWSGTLLTARALSACDPAPTTHECKHAIADAIKQVAAQLGNTPAICRKCYVHPAILTAYTHGKLTHPSATDADDEAALLALLRQLPS